jgi:voltage-gated potassium channel
VAVSSVDLRPPTERPVDPAPTSGVLGIVYEGVMLLLATTVIVLIAQPDRGLVRTANLVIWAIFVIDYVTRLVLSGDRRAFVRANLIDLVAIMPADLFRAARALRILRVVRLLRAAAVLWRVSVAIRGITGTNALGWVLVASTVVVLIGAGGVMVAEPGMEQFGDALWWSIVTSTTVGYGDISPESVVGRVVAVVLMLVGIGTIGMITGSIATYFLGDRDRGPDDPHVAHLKAVLDSWDELTVEQRRQAAALLDAMAEVPRPSVGADASRH